MIILRNANIEDAKILFGWRNDELTRLNSHNTNPIEFTSHLEWLKNTINNKNRMLLIVENNTIPVGTVRVDIDSIGYEISWTVSPDHRGKGFAKEMVSKVIANLSGKIRAEIKTDNSASIAVAKFIGMSLEHESDGILFFSINK